MVRVTSQPEGQEGTPTSRQLTSAVTAQLADLHQRSKITKGQWSRSPARCSVSKQLWALVNELHTLAGVSTEELGAVLGVKPSTVLAQLRHHGFLGGPSASQRLVHEAAGPAQSPGLPGPRLAAAVDRTRRARKRLATAKTQRATAEEELRQAVVAEHAASHTSAWALSVQAGVTVRTVRRWLAADGAGADGPTDSSPS
jgi:DNA-binding CsgD family transcriptional regulator